MNKWLMLGISVVLVFVAKVSALRGLPWALVSFFIVGLIVMWTGFETFNWLPKQSASVDTHSGATTITSLFVIALLIIVFMYQEKASRNAFKTAMDSCMNTSIQSYIDYADVLNNTPQEIATSIQYAHSECANASMSDTLAKAEAINK